MNIQNAPERWRRFPVEFGRPLAGSERLTGLFLALGALMPLLMGIPLPAAEDEPGSGAEIYRRRCASCHGASGEGTRDEYPQPLAGDRSVAQLARFIARSMPADDPGSCRGDQAEKVAAYIHEAFYAREAPAPPAVPRLGLSRLTASQYRNAVADLLAELGKPIQKDPRHGLLGEYFASAPSKEDRHIFQRLDPELRFDFARSSPDPGRIEPKAFRIQWHGSLLAPETGEYQFLIRTEHSVRLSLNDGKRLAIDAWVKSGDETEYRASVKLLGGRAYPMAVGFSKASLLPSRSKSEDANKPASIVLQWVRPHRTAETIPTRYLSPSNAAETLVLETPLPADDRSAGYERGTSVSKAWDQATTDAAIEAAEYVTSHIQNFTGLDEADPEDRPRLLEFCQRFAERAFRRPLTEEQKQLYVNGPFESTSDPLGSIERVVILVLKSPRFLYHELGSDPYAVASRLAFAIWDSVPDSTLVEEAKAGRLATRAQVVAQARRMEKDPRADARIRDFLFQWMRLEHPPDLGRSSAEYPGFDVKAASDLRESLELFLDEVISAEPADFRRLLLADHLYLNGRLARLYGVDLPADAPFGKVAIDGGRRAGVLTHPYLMTAFASSESTSPIHRGVFLVRSVLGRALRPPPEAFAPLPVSLHPGLTTRQRVELQTKDRACQSCHGLINPLGFTLENFDPIGRYRDRDQGHPIDASGSYLSRRGELRAFQGATELARYLAASEETHRAFVERMFRHAVKAPVQAFGADALPGLDRRFAESGFDLHALRVEIATISALRAGLSKTALSIPETLERERLVPRFDAEHLAVVPEGSARTPEES